MVEAYVTSSVVYGSLFGLMAIGLTLTYLTTKVPNFAYGSFVTIGMYTSFSLYRLEGASAYATAPAAFALGGLTAVMMYLGILRPLTRRGSSLVALMIATFAVDIGFIGIFGIYSDYLYNVYNFIDSKSFYQFGNDFILFGLPGIFYMAPVSLALITIGLFLLLTRTRFGVAMRASVENPSLARILGIHVERVYVFAWLLAGGFAAMSGSYWDLWQPGGVFVGSNLIVEIFAASVLGGLASIYGAAVGGVIIGASEILPTTALSAFFGSFVSIYQKAAPLMIMIITLLALPQGLASIDWRKIFLDPLQQGMQRYMWRPVSRFIRLNGRKILRTKREK